MRHLLSVMVLCGYGWVLSCHRVVAGGAIALAGRHGAFFAIHPWVGRACSAVGARAPGAVAARVPKPALNRALCLLARSVPN